MPRAPWLALALLLGAAPAGAQPRPAEAQIGSWELSCPSAADSPCLLRHRNWVLSPGGARPTAAVEVQRRGEALVPVVALRGLPMQAALGGVMAMQPAVGLRFDDGPRITLSCGLDDGAILCAPQGPAVGAAAAALPHARSVTVQMALTVPGMGALPEQDRVLDLAVTPQALARYRAAGASGEALPAEPGLDWQQFLDRVLKAAGFANGAADLLPAVSKAARRY
jgi:hypothetical protein